MANTLLCDVADELMHVITSYWIIIITTSFLFQLDF